MRETESMSNTLQTVLLFAAVIGGLSGWAAIAAWWYRERTKTVRAIKDLRRTNARLQKAVVFTLDKWRDQVEHNQLFLAIEQEYAERLAREAGVSPQAVKSTMRASVEQAARNGDPLKTDPTNASRVRHQLAAIEDVERFVETGEGVLAEFEITDAFRNAA